MKYLIHSVSIASLIAVSGPAAAYQAQPAAPREDTYVYFYDELGSSTGVPATLGIVRQGFAADALFNQCRPQGDPQAAAVIVPLALGLFKIFGNIVDTRLREREKQRIERMSRSFAGLRNQAAFPLQARSAGTPAFRCLVVDRIAEVNGRPESRATYVLGLRQLAGSTTAFTVEPLAARIDSSSLLARPANRVNATVTVAFQSVVAAGSANQLSTPPSFSATFKNLARGVIGRANPQEQRNSPLIPIQQANAATTTAVAVTEADVGLASEQQRIALEQANRTLLISALGDILKAAITD